MDVLLYNSAVCRLCGEENENGTLLYSCEESEENVCDLINTYLPLKVSDDGQLPRTICPGCTIQVEATVEFLNLIIKGQKIIRELHSNEKAYRKSLIQKLDTSGTEFPEKLYYEINTSNGVYQVEHPMSLQTAGLDKPKRKRGRPPKKPKSPEEMAAEAAEREKETARIKASREANSKRELTGKRRRKTPTRFNEAVQGKELERIFKEEGVIDAEESDPDSKPDVEPEPKSPVNREPEIIGHLETSGELVVVVQGKGRGRPKGRMRPTREQCAICGMEFSCVGRYMSHIAQHGPVVYQCTQCDLRAVTRLQFTQHQTDTGHTGQNVIQLKNEKAEQEKQDEAPIESDPLSIEDVAQPSHLSPASLNLMPTSAKVESDAKALEDVFVKGLVNECRSDGDGDSSIVDVESSPGAGGDKAAKNDANTSTEAVDDEEEIEIEVKGKAKLKCNHCDKTFSSRQSKSMHIKAMHKGERPYVCKECGAAFPYPRSLSIHALSHRRTNPSKGFACDLCGKVLNHPSSVVYHKEAEHAGRQYVCIKCGKGFKHKQLLQRHQLVHTQVRPYTCQTCGASFKTKPNLMNHQLLHTGVKKFTCEICKQKFAHKTSLTLHMRLHTGLKPFSCNVCGKSFSQKGNLSEHSRIHTGEKPYKCTICPRSFTTSSQHRLHLRRHSADRPHECTHCGKRFLSRESWRVHMRREAGARAHRCNACPRAFCERWALLKHQRKHTGERPFRCPHCPRAFADCSNLNKHKKQVHKQQISLLVSENQRATAAPAAAGPQPARGPKAEAESGPEAEMERVIYVTYDVEDESGFHILEEDMAEEASNLEHVQCKVLQPSPLYSGQSLLVHDQQLSLQHQVRVLSPEPASPPPAQEHMAVTDEQGNPLHFTMQDGTKLAITSADGKSLQVITQDGRTIPVEINGYNEEEIDEDVISQDGCTIPVEINDFNEGEIGEEVETDTVVHLELQNTMEANGSAPVANYFTIV